MLSQNTRYGAYLIMKISERRTYGFDSEAAEISVEIGGHQVSKGKAYMSQIIRENKRKRNTSSSLLLSNGNGLKMETWELIDDENEQISCEKEEDEWMEVELGEFFNGGGDDDDDDDGDDEVKMSFKEVKGYQLKGGIIIEGI